MVNNQMMKNENSNVQKAVQFEYKQDGKFLNIKMPVVDVKVKSIRAKTNYKKRSIEIENPKFKDQSIFINGKGKIGMLADFLGINRANLIGAIDHNDIEYIQARINMQPKDRIIQIGASKFSYLDHKTEERIERFYAYVISTNKHLIITFKEIESIVTSVLGIGITESHFQSVKAFTKIYSTFETAGDSFLSSIQVTTGKNTKASAIKVVVRVKVGSCSNSIIVANYTAIKRLKGCLDRLRNTLINAAEIIQSTQEIITAGIKKELTLEEGLVYIDNINLSIKNEEKINNIKEALKIRFKHEFKSNKNRFALSQALSFGGTHFLAEKTSERTLEMLSEQSFEVLAAAILQTQVIQ